MMRRQSISGFTLIELVIVIVIMGIISVVIGRILIASYATFQTSNNISIIDWNGLLALERMTNDIHALRSPASVTTMTATQLSFVNVNGTTIQYQLSGTSLLRNSQVLASNIQSLAFSYLDSTGTTTAVTSAMRYVGITLNLNAGSYTTVFNTLVATRILT